MPHSCEDCQGVVLPPLQWIYKLIESVHVWYIDDTLHPGLGTAGHHGRVSFHIVYTLQTDSGFPLLCWEAFAFVFNLILCHSHSILHEDCPHRGIGFLHTCSQGCCCLIASASCTQVTTLVSVSSESNCNFSASEVSRIPTTILQSRIISLYRFPYPQYSASP